MVGELILAQLFAGQRGPQRVGASSRRIVLVARRDVGGTHGAGSHLATDPGAVAHLDRGGESTVSREAEVRLDRHGVVVGPVAQVIGH